MKLILVVPELDSKMKIEVDALDYMIGRVLLVECNDR